MKPAPTRQAGYTIIEVMIFLVVSGVLLLSAFSLFSGRIQKNQFTQSVQTLDTHIKTIANEVTTGTYPSGQSFDCTVSGSGPPTISNPGNADDQGTRTDCIFLGKIINFTVPNTNCTVPAATTFCTKIEVYTVVGRRLDPGGNVVNSMTAASPVVVNTPVNLTESFDLSYGTHATGLFQNNANLNLGFPLRSAVGFFQSFNGNYGSGGNLNSGAQNVSTWLVRTPSAPAAPIQVGGNNGIRGLVATGAATPANGLFAKPTPPDDNVYVCLRSSDNSQKASITLRGSSNGLTTAVAIGDPKCP